MKKLNFLLILLLILAGCSNKVLLPNTVNKGLSYDANSLSINKDSFPFAVNYSRGEINQLKKDLKNNPASLNTFTRTDILNLLGNPIIIKQTDILNIWQYRSTCVVNIVWQKTDQPEESLSLEIGNQVKSTNFNNSSTDSDLNHTAPKVNLDGYKIAWIESVDSSKNSIDSFKCISSML